jgi:autotransporter strand-loop-strand O-heptosyltransferase
VNLYFSVGGGFPVMSIAVVRAGVPEAAKPALSIVNDVSADAATPPAVLTPSVSTVTPSATEPAPAAKPAYPPASEIPTQEGPKGLRFDFNDGCRVTFPESEHPWRVQLRDLDTGNVIYQTEIKGGRINSSKRYFIRFRLEIWRQDECLLAHDYSAADREVLIQFPVGTLGDTMGWFPYAVKFNDKHGCKLTCGMAEKLIPLFRDAYPDINFVPHEEIKAEKFYATYSMGLFFDDKDCIRQPCDFRYVGLHRTAGYILGVDPTEVPPRIKVADESLHRGAKHDTGEVLEQPRRLV